MRLLLIILLFACSPKKVEEKPAFDVYQDTIYLKRDSTNVYYFYGKFEMKPGTAQRNIPLKIK